jgi:anti-sigma regulatory factor (Ser/Thr protein kinase)
MASFVDNLPNVPKQMRKAAVVDYLQAQLAAGGNEDGARATVLAIATLGRKWERWVLLLAQEYSVPPEVQRVLQVVVAIDEKQYRREIVVTERGTGLGRAEVESLLDGIESLQDTRGRCHLKIVFDTSQVYVYGLCAIAAWAYQNAVDIEFDCRQPRVEHFLTRAGFFEALRNPESEPVRFDTETILGFTRIDPATRFETDAHAGRLVGLFRKHIDLPESAARALATSFAELIENAVKHGRIARPAWLFANYHPQPKIMHICVCDRGIGIQQSFLDSENPEIRALGKTPHDWIKTCTDPLVTSKSREHAGYGLYLVRELCRRNGGQFLLVSGSAAYRIGHRPTTGTQGSQVESITNRSVAWHGTLVAVQLRMDGPIDLNPVYNSLPMPAGYTEGERFDLFGA